MNGFRKKGMNFNNVPQIQNMELSFFKRDI